QVEYGYGSRGCIGVPVEFAELLFAEAQLGTRVRIEWGSAIDENGFIAMTAPAEETQSQS
ncbi:MAG: L,D-transpeptidase, partial [Sphingomonadaceae bacterium]|nr:L,D-transpeptidase [Sphingomonadaceae bacterium]